ncbi:hypothetical protein G9A89_012167 [Geosiphon pyriformis]|nr:hypothetical protein G9A89_012167 [Geosiphon pyriformis]
MQQINLIARILVPFFPNTGTRNFARRRHRRHRNQTQNNTGPESSSTRNNSETSQTLNSISTMRSSIKNHVSTTPNGPERMDSAIALIDDVEQDSKKGKGAAISILEQASLPDPSVIIQDPLGIDLKGKEKQVKEVICHFEKLPLEVKVKIFKWLDVVEVIRTSMVCRSWHSLAFDGSLWSQIDVAPFYQKISTDQLIALWKSAGGFLKDVNFRGCVQLTGKNLRELAPYCPNIQTLQLSGCRNLDSGGIDILLSHLHNLQELNLSGLDLISTQNSCIRTLAKQCKRLKKVNLSWCRYLSSRDIEILVKGCKELTSLKLDGQPELIESTLAMIGELRHLQVLSLDSCTAINDNLIAALFQTGGANDNSSTTAATMTTTTYSLSPPPITHLNLANNLNLTDTALQDLADFCPTLTHLQLHGCPGFTDHGLIYLISKCIEIQALDLEDCNSAVNDDVLNAIARHLPKLRSVCLSYCEQITDDAVTNLLRECTNISRIDLDQCQSLTDTVLHNIADILTTAASMGLIRDHSTYANSVIDDDSASSNSNQSPQLASLVSRRNNMRPKLIEIEIFDCRNISIATVRETVKKVSAAGVLLKLKGYYAWQATRNPRNRNEDNNGGGEEEDEDSGRNNTAGNGGHPSFWSRSRIFRHLRNGDIIPDMAMRFQFQTAFRGAGYRAGNGGHNAGHGRRLDVWCNELINRDFKTGKG